MSTIAQNTGLILHIQAYFRDFRVLSEAKTGTTLKTQRTIKVSFKRFFKNPTTKLVNIKPKKHFLKLFSMHINSLRSILQAVFQTKSCHSTAVFNMVNYDLLIYLTVASRLGYCNSLYVGLPLRLAQKFQLIQNTASHIFTGIRRECA